MLSWLWSTNTGILYLKETNIIVVSKSFKLFRSWWHCLGTEGRVNLSVWVPVVFGFIKGSNGQGRFSIRGGIEKLVATLTILFKVKWVCQLPVSFKNCLHSYNPVVKRVLECFVDWGLLQRVWCLMTHEQSVIEELKMWDNIERDMLSILFDLEDPFCHFVDSCILPHHV